MSYYLDIISNYYGIFSIINLLFTFCFAYCTLKIALIAVSEKKQSEAKLYLTIGSWALVSLLVGQITLVITEFQPSIAVASLQEQLREAKSTLSKNSTDLESHRTESSKNQMEIHKLRSEIDQLKIDRSRQAKEKSELEKDNMQIPALNSKLEDIKNEKSKLETQMAILEHSNRLLNDENTKLAAQIKVSSHELLSLSTEIATCTTESRQQQRDIDKLNKNLSLLAVKNKEEQDIILEKLALCNTNYETLTREKREAEQKDDPSKEATGPNK